MRLGGLIPVSKIIARRKSVCGYWNGRTASVRGLPYCDLGHFPTMPGLGAEAPCLGEARTCPDYCALATLLGRLPTAEETP